MKLPPSDFIPELVSNDSQTIVQEGIDGNATGDQAVFLIPFTRYRVKNIVVFGASAVPSVGFAAGVFTAAAGAGTNLLNAPVWTGLTSPSVMSLLALASIVNSVVRTEPELYFNVSVANGAPLLLNIAIEVAIL